MIRREGCSARVALLRNVILMFANLYSPLTLRLVQTSCNSAAATSDCRSPLQKNRKFAIYSDLALTVAATSN